MVRTSNANVEMDNNPFNAVFTVSSKSDVIVGEGNVKVRWKLAEAVFEISTDAHRAHLSRDQFIELLNFSVFAKKRHAEFKSTASSRGDILRIHAELDTGLSVTCEEDENTRRLLFAVLVPSSLERATMNETDVDMLLRFKGRAERIKVDDPFEPEQAKTPLLVGGAEQQQKNINKLLSSRREQQLQGVNEKHKSRLNAGEPAERSLTEMGKQKRTIKSRVSLRA